MGPNQLDVYLDQNVLSSLANGPPWATTKLGKLLSRAEVRTWVSAVHFAEIAQTNDPAVRAGLARTALEIARYRSVLPGYEYLVSKAFADWLNKTAPGAVRGFEYLEHHLEDSLQTIVGMLAVMAAGQSVAEELTASIARDKFGTQKLHAHAVADPGTWIAGLLKCADQLLLVSASADEKMGDTSVNELREAAREIQPGDGIHQKLRQTLNKHRRAIARAYGAIEIGGCLLAALPLPCGVDYTFDANVIQDKWRELHIAAGTDVVPTPDTSDGVLTLLKQLTLALARGNGLLLATIANETVVRQVEGFAARSKLPNAGIGFDGDHAVYLGHVALFVSDDDDLRTAARPLAEMLKKENPGSRKVEVVTSDQAQSAIRRLIQ